MPRFAPVIRTVLASSVVPSFISKPPRSFLRWIRASIEAGYLRAAATYLQLVRESSSRDRQIERDGQAGLWQVSRRGQGHQRIHVLQRPLETRRIGMAAPKCLLALGRDDQTIVPTRRLSGTLRRAPARSGSPFAPRGRDAVRRSLDGSGVSRRVRIVQRAATRRRPPSVLPVYGISIETSPVSGKAPKFSCAPAAVGHVLGKFSGSPGYGGVSSSGPTSAKPA